MTAPDYGKGFTDGYRTALLDIHADLEELTDSDGSLSGGDTVEYLGNLFKTHDIRPEPTIEIEPPQGVEFDDDNIVGTREALLLLARNIHDTLEGADQ